MPLFNGRDVIGRCLETIPDHVEAIVVDDGSTDGAPDLVAARFPFVRILRNSSNLGFGATANRGLQNASGAVRVVLNSDARLRPGALDELVGAFRDQRVGIAGARLVFPDGSHQTSAASFPTPGRTLAGSFLLNEMYRSLWPRGRFRWELGMARRDHDRDRDVDWVMGTCIAIRDLCLQDVGGFDEAYFMYVEETDLCWRAHSAGWLVRYVSSSVVEHEGGGSSGDPSQHAERLLSSEARFMLRSYGPAGLERWAMARLIGSAAKTVILLPVMALDRRLRARWRWQWAALRYIGGRRWRSSASA